MQKADDLGVHDAGLTPGMMRRARQRPAAAPAAAGPVNPAARLALAPEADDDGFGEWLAHVEAGSLPPQGHPAPPRLSGHCFPLSYSPHTVP